MTDSRRWRKVRRHLPGPRIALGTLLLACVVISACAAESKKSHTVNAAEISPAALRRHCEEDIARGDSRHRRADPIDVERCVSRHQNDSINLLLDRMEEPASNASPSKP